MKTESMIVRECCDYLAERKEFFWRMNNIPAPGRALPKYTPKGLPDIMAIIDGKFYAIECKRSAGVEGEREKNGRTVRGGKLSPHQAEWAAKAVIAGAAYIICHSVEELRMNLPIKA